MIKVLFLLCLSVCLAAARNEQYEGHSLYEIAASNTEQAKQVNQLENFLQVDMWSEALLGRPGQVLVPPAVKGSFEEALQSIGVEFKVVVEDIKEQIELEDELLTEAARKSNATRSRATIGLPFDTIYRYDVVDAYLVELARRYPSTVQVASAGRSFEGRDIKYLKISSTNFQDKTKPVVMMESLLHCREWVGLPATLCAIHKWVGLPATLCAIHKWVGLPATLCAIHKWVGLPATLCAIHKWVGLPATLCAIHKWVGLPATLCAIHKLVLVLDASEPELLRDIDWTIMPIANPDGYEFTHSSSRFWRKNRATGYMIGNICMGVDLNRNFDMNFGAASSNSPCTDTFHGSGAFSEPETASIRDVILEHRHRLELFLDIHSFGSMILYGYGDGILPPNGLSIHVAGIRMAEGIDSVKWPSNPNYIVGNVASVLYAASGSAQDYAQSVGATLSYTYELPAYRNSATLYGIMVDPDFIEQAGYETWEGIKAGARYALENFRVRMRTSK